MLKRALDRDTLSRFREALEARRRELLRHREARTLSAVPRILPELERALERIETGELGACAACEHPVDTALLELDFTSCVCLGHYSGDELRALEQDLECAARVQRNALPSALPIVPGWQIASLLQPARIVSGDTVDFFRLESGNQALAVADVMGKGVSAGMLAASLQSALRILGPEYDDPGALLGRINQVLRYNLNVISFVTLIVLELDATSATVRYANAGHEPPLWWGSRARALAQWKATGPAIGLDPEASYGTESVACGEGDVVLLYTDGLVESRDTRGELFGIDRLAALFPEHTSSAARLLQRSRAAIQRFSGGAPQDDLTLVALKRGA